LKRREFITLLGGGAAWPLVARAQQPGRLPTIGYLGGISAVEESRYTAAFLQRLRELGWTEGRNVTIEYRWSDGRTERAAEIADEFVRLKVDVILTSGNEFALVAKLATPIIPIVFALAGDPVGTGLIDSLARPGGNVTGLSNQLTDAAGKRVELLYEVVPTLRRLAIMAHVNPLSVAELTDARAAASRLGLEVMALEIRQREDVGLGFDALKNRADALYVTNSAFLAANRLRITTRRWERDWRPCSLLGLGSMRAV
jgi:putative ABC transport system substrate-binding protein